MKATDDELKMCRTRRGAVSHTLKMYLEMVSIKMLLAKILKGGFKKGNVISFRAQFISIDIMSRPFVDQPVNTVVVNNQVFPSNPHSGLRPNLMDSIS